MKKNNAILASLQILLTPKEVEKVAEAFGYNIKSRKMSVYNLLEYFVISSTEQSKSYRGQSPMLKAVNRRVFIIRSCLKRLELCHIRYLRTSFICCSKNAIANAIEK